MSTLPSVIEAEPAAAPPAPDPIPQPPTAPPLENESYQAACRKLDELVASRMAVELRLEDAVERSQRKGPLPAVVASRAAALFRGEPAEYEPIEHVARLAEDVDVARAAENLARAHRDDTGKAICRRISEETRETFQALAGESYRAFERFIECEERIDAFEQKLAAGGAHDVYHRQRLYLMGNIVGVRNVLCHYWDTLGATGPADNPILGAARPNTPNPSENHVGN